MTCDTTGFITSNETLPVLEHGKSSCFGVVTKESVQLSAKKSAEKVYMAHPHKTEAEVPEGYASLSPKVSPAPLNSDCLCGISFG